MSWDDDLTEAERADWDGFVRHVRENTLKAMEESAFVASLVPSGKPDIKFAVELGLAIMLDKPVIAIVLPGTPVPAGLRKVADSIICADIDTEAGRRDAQAQMKKAMARIAR